MLKWDYILYILYEKLNLSAITISLLSIGLFVAMIPWSVITGVWNNIDYPLISSYTTWLGDIFLGIANYFIIVYYISLPHPPNYHFNKNQYIFVLLISFIVSIIFHFVFLVDSLYGWTEVSASGGWSALGYYHIILFTLEFSLIINFFLSIRSYLKSNILENIQELNVLADLSIKGFYAMFFISIYLNILVFTFTKFSIEHNAVYLQLIMKILMYIPIYIVWFPLIFFLQLAPIYKIIKLEKRRIPINYVQKWPFSVKTISKIIIMSIFLILLVIIQNLFILEVSN